MIQHGTLTILPQANPSFQRTRGGGFDEGARKYKMKSNNAHRYLNQVFVPGQRDTDLARLCGYRLQAFPNMVLDSATLEYDDGDTAVINANFLGILGDQPKPWSITRSTSFGSVALVKPGTNYVSRIPQPKPTITYVFCTIGKRLLLGQVTQEFTNPPGTTTLENQVIENAFEGFYSGLTPLFSGWVFASISVRTPGDLMNDHHVAENTLSITYETINAQ